jgi:hypothetical protein
VVETNSTMPIERSLGNPTRLAGDRRSAILLEAPRGASVP